jgi:hypothetical protein
VNLSTPYYRAVNAVVVGMFVLVIGGTMAEDVSAIDRSDWLALAAPLLLLVRVVRLGIKVDEQRIVVRSWFTTRRIARVDLVGARAADYDGAWGTFPLECLNQLELEIRGREDNPLAVRAIVATRRSRRVQRIAYQLRGLSKQPTDGVD